MKRWKSLTLISIVSSLLACTHQVETGRPTMAPGGVGPIGTGQIDELESMVKGQLDDLNSCYKEERKRNPEATGKVLFAFIVQKDGSTDEIRLLASTLKSPVMEGCLLGKIEDWQLTPPRDGQPMNVRYPFSFQP
jgi:hypothetical protein